MYTHIYIYICTHTHISQQIHIYDIYITKCQKKQLAILAELITELIVTMEIGESSHEGTYTPIIFHFDNWNHKTSILNNKSNC